MAAVAVKSFCPTMGLLYNGRCADNQIRLRRKGNTKSANYKILNFAGAFRLLRAHKERLVNRSLCTPG